MPTTTIKIRRVLVDSQAPPKAAHKFLFTRVGVDLVLEVGYYDFPELRDAIKASESEARSAEPPIVTVNVTDRFVLSPQGVMDLAQVAEELKKDVETYAQPSEDAVPPRKEDA